MPRVPSSAPGKPLILAHRYGSDSGGSIGHVFQEALRAEPQGPARQIVVKRRQGAPHQRHCDVPLPTYIAFRVSQGITPREAVQEWNGGQILQQ